MRLSINQKVVWRIFSHDLSLFKILPSAPEVVLSSHIVTACAVKTQIMLKLNKPVMYN